MSLQIRSRPDYVPAVKLRPSSGAYLMGIKRERPVTNSAEVEVAHDLSAASLPILATANDAREFVRYLNKRPNGVTMVEAMNAEPRRIFDARKIAAYEFWGIVRRENDRLVLTENGQDLADTLGPESLMHRDILRRIQAYRAAVQNIYDEGLDIATHLDVLRHWSQLHTIAGIDRLDPQDLEAAVVCFFSLCHAAELGTSTVGKRGQPTRLRVDMEQVAAFLSEETSVRIPKKTEPARRIVQFESAAIRQVLISSSGPAEHVDNLVSLLALAGFDSVTINFADFENGLLPSSELTEMQQCQAGIFVIRPNDCVRKKDGSSSLRHEWVTKISVAAALFDWRVLLFWNGQLPPPDELTTSGLTFLSSENLDWKACLEMANRIKTLAFPPIA